MTPARSRQLLRRHEIRLLAIQPRLQNPTGADLAPPRRRTWWRWRRHHGFFILEDGVYGDLRLAGEDPGPLRALAPAHVIYVDSLSKTVGPGLRAGWVGGDRAGPRSDHRREARRRRARRDPDPARDRDLPDRRPLPGPARARAQPLPRAARRHARGARAGARRPVHFTRPAGGGHVWVTLRRPWRRSRSTAERSPPA